LNFRPAKKTRNAVKNEKRRKLITLQGREKGLGIRLLVLKFKTPPRNRVAKVGKGVESGGSQGFFSRVSDFPFY
jgi:hypothetical protein